MALVGVQHNTHACMHHSRARVAVHRYTSAYLTAEHMTKLCLREVGPWVVRVESLPVGLVEVLSAGVVVEVPCFAQACRQRWDPAA
jgi:hypothetical protein